MRLTATVFLNSLGPLYCRYSSVACRFAYSGMSVRERLGTSEMNGSLDE